MLQRLLVRGAAARRRQAARNPGVIGLNGPATGEAAVQECRGGAGEKDGAPCPDAAYEWRDLPISAAAA
jgi:hypothetical protein